VQFEKRLRLGVGLRGGLRLGVRFGKGLRLGIRLRLGLREVDDLLWSVSVG
jgi:hypothetical protein